MFNQNKIKACPNCAETMYNLDLDASHVEKWQCSKCGYKDEKTLLDAQLDMLNRY